MDLTNLANSTKNAERRVQVSEVWLTTKQLESLAKMRSADAQSAARTSFQSQNLLKVGNSKTLEFISRASSMPQGAAQAQWDALVDAPSAGGSVSTTELSSQKSKSQIVNVEDVWLTTDQMASLSKMDNGTAKGAATTGYKKSNLEAVGSAGVADFLRMSKVMPSSAAQSKWDGMVASARKAAPSIKSDPIEGDSSSSALSAPKSDSAASHTTQAMPSSSGNSVQEVVTSVTTLAGLSGMLTTVKDSEALSDEVPDVVSMRPDDKSSDLPSAKQIAVGVAAGIGIAGATILLVGLASGFIQRYARRKAAQAGVGGFWSKVACIPSFAQPFNPLLKFSHYQDIRDFLDNKPDGTTNLWDWYKQLSRTAHLAFLGHVDGEGDWFYSNEDENGEVGIEPCDDWGGLLGFNITVGQNKYDVIAALSDSDFVLSTVGSNDLQVVRAASFGEVAAGRLTI